MWRKVVLNCKVIGMTNNGERFAVVTGASSGVGRAVAYDLSVSGWHVVAIARRQSKLLELQREAESAGGKVTVLSADLSDEHTQVPPLLPPPGVRPSEVVLVYAAGVFGPIGLMGVESLDDWMRTIQTNFLGAVRVTNALLPLIREVGKGRLVYVSSSQALHEPDPLVTAYATSKVALNFFAASTSKEFVGSDVAVVALHPGDLKTEMWEQIQTSAGNAGPEAALYSEWAERVGLTGGDGLDAAVAIVREAIDRPAAEVNGEFLVAGGGLVDHPQPGRVGTSNG